MRELSIDTKNNVVLRMMEDLERTLQKPVEERHWGMVIDTQKCIGCSSCPDTMSFKRGDVSLALKPVPRKILVMLMKKANRVVTRQEIEREIWHDRN